MPALVNRPRTELNRSDHWDFEVRSDETWSKAAFHWSRSVVTQRRKRFILWGLRMSPESAPAGLHDALAARSCDPTGHQPMRPASKALQLAEMEGSSVLACAMNEIRVERQKGAYGMFRAMEIVVDGVAMGKIGQGQSSTFMLPDGGRQVWGKMDWGETERLELADGGPGKTVVFQAYFTLNLLRQLGIAKLPFKVFFRGDRPEETGGE